MVDTVMRGGDTDTNAAICGALLAPCTIGMRFPFNGPNAYSTAVLQPDRRAWTDFARALLDDGCVRVGGALDLVR